MQGTKHQVPRQGGLDRYLRGLAVALVARHPVEPVALLQERLDLLLVVVAAVALVVAVVLAAVAAPAVAAALDAAAAVAAVKII